MRNTVTNIIELLIGAILMGLALVYLTSQYRALFNLTDIITQETIRDSSVFQQFSDISIKQISYEEVYAAIMGYREYPIMVDDKLIPENGYDYELYFSYVKKGLYNKEYRFDDKRKIIMIIYSFISV